MQSTKTTNRRYIMTKEKELLDAMDEIRVMLEDGLITFQEFLNKSIFVLIAYGER